MNTASLDNLTGTTIGQYTLRERLGVGGMGVVYSAFQENLQRTVAIKLLSPVLATQADSNERFIREARTAASLEHAHIVPVYDYGTQGELSYVVMRLLTGGTLLERIRYHAGGLPSLGEIAMLLTQVAGALSYAHSRGIIHRDIKPSNIMFDHQGNAFLVDFGIAKLLDEVGITNSGLAIGTPTHMPPEQWRGEAVTPASDQYALAVVLYEVAAGRLPFETGSAFALMNKHLTEMPIPLDELRPDVPKAVGVVLERALAKDPQVRYPTVQDFAAEFAQAVSGAEGQSTNLFTFGLPHTEPHPSVPAEHFSAFVPAERNTPVTQANPEELIAIQSAVEKRLKARQGVIIHLFSYLTVNAIFWILWGDGGWPLLVAFAWGTGLALHIVETFFETAPGSKWHRREMGRELAQRGYDPALANRTVFTTSGQFHSAHASGGELLPTERADTAPEIPDDDTVGRDALVVDVAEK